MWNWSKNLLKEHTWRVMMGKALDRHVYHDFEKTPHMCVSGMTLKNSPLLSIQ